MTEITVVPKEMPGGVTFDMKLEGARLAATKVYLKGVLQSALFEEIDSAALQQIKEAIIRFPLIYSAEVVYENKAHTIGVSYMTWDDYAHTSRPVHIMKVSTGGTADEKKVVAADR